MGIYLDNASTTYMYKEVLDAMGPYLSGGFFNPSAGYSVSRKVRNVINNCREEIAALIGAKPDEIYFTSGGTESDNWACNEAIRRKCHIISTQIEHKAILNPLAAYGMSGGKVTLVPVNEYGEVSPEVIRNCIKPGTGMISVMMANNEIGTIEPIEKIGHIAKEYGVMFHSDGVQAFGHIPINVDKYNLDMLSVSSHKFHGPKGVGFLYVRKDVDIASFIRGGGQEFNKRSGTENVPGIVGMTKAAIISSRNLDRSMPYLMGIRDYIISRLSERMPGIKINGAVKNRLPNNINFSIKGVDGQSMLALLDLEGIYASAGSACNTNKNGYSHVLKAIGLEDKSIAGTIRLSLDESITRAKADYVIEAIIRISKKIKEN